MEKLETIRTTDHLLIEEIASHLHATILSATTRVFRSYSQYDETVERLKFMVRDQIEVICLLNEIKERINLVTSAKRDDERWDPLDHLSYTVSSLMLYLMGMFSDSGYSTWNLLSLLNDISIDDSMDKRIPKWLLDHALSASIDQTEARQQCPKGIDIALYDRGMSQQEIALVESSIGKMLYLEEKYKSLIASFFTPNLEPSTIIYLPQFVESMGAKILSAALLFRVILQPYKVGVFPMPTSSLQNKNES